MGTKYDKYMIDLFFVNDNINQSNNIKFKKRKLRYTNILHYLETRYNDSETIRETLYRIKYNIEEKPTCPVCGKKLKFNGRENKIYLSHCSNRCKKLDKNVKEKWIASCGSKGTNREKAKETCKKKYGVENPYQIPKVIQKIKDINIAKHDQIVENMKKTCLEKYGKEFYFQTDEFKQKSIETSIKKYGVEHPIQSKVVQSKYNWPNVVPKITETKRKNNSFNISKDEEETYQILIKKYPNVIRQYKSELYPFHCDFYISNLDLYLECNYHWTHGKHLYDPNSKEDQERLKTLITRSKTNKYYKSTIYVWTILDPKKLKTAQDNNLNYLIFYNLDEFKEWISHID